jgi:hypothetical protein
MTDDEAALKRRRHEMRVNTTFSQICAPGRPIFNTWTHQRIQGEFLDYVHTWLETVAKPLDGSPPPSGVMIYRDPDGRFAYAVALGCTGFLRYQLTPDGKIQPLDPTIESTPQGFEQLEFLGTEVDLARLFEAAAVLESLPPDVVAALHRWAERLRKRFPTLFPPK